MKKTWLVMIGFLLFLAGCQAPEDPEPLPAVKPEGPAALVQPAEPSGFYFSAAAFESETDRALRAFSLPVENPTGIRFLGSKILLFSGAGNTVLTLISPEDCHAETEISLSCAVSPEDPAVTVTENGVTYYDSPSGELVFLDTSLKENRRISLPECRPGITEDWANVYYCAGNALRVLDPETGIDRLLKEMNHSRPELAAIHCSGSILECTATDSSGQTVTQLIDAATGTALREISGRPLLKTNGDFFVTVHYDGNYPELLSGSRDFGPNVLVAGDENSSIEVINGARGLILVTQRNADPVAVLNYYDLESGLHPYQLTLPEYIRPVSILADPAQNVLWFLSSSETAYLFRWDLNRSKTNDLLCYLQSRHTPENPDLEGLRRCRDTAAKISEKHGVDILFWTDALSWVPEGYILTPEYQVPWIETYLLKLDRILSLYPAGFLKKAAEETPRGRLTVCLARDIADDSGSIDGLQFWNSRGNACLILAMNTQMEQTALRKIFHLIDSRVLCTVPAYDSWNKLNPKDFEYDYDYIQNLSRDPSDLTEGPNRAFTDCLSMSFPREDRAGIMEYAMLSGKESCFSSEIMQLKLRTLCVGIRDSFGPPKDMPYLWEQYLHDPL